MASTCKEKLFFGKKVLLFTVPGKEVGQEASKDGQEAVGHSTVRKVLRFTVPGKEVGHEASKDCQEAVGHSEDGQGAC